MHDPQGILRQLQASRKADTSIVCVNLHLRYSSALQDADSFERQATSIDRWIAEWRAINPGREMQVHRIGREPEVSRQLGVSEREALKEHIQDVRDGRCQWVLCEEASRIGTGAVFDEFSGLVERYGGRVIVTSRGIPRDRWEGRTRSLIDGLVSGLEVVNISRRTWGTKAALTQSEPTRWVTGGSPGLGFMVVCKCRVCGVYSRDLYCDEHDGPPPPGKIAKYRVPLDYFEVPPTTTPREAAKQSAVRRLVRRLFEMATDPTCCWRDLADAINAEGWRVERGGEMLAYAKDAPREIVRNPYYAGLAVYNRTSQPVGGRKRYNPISEWIVSPLEVDFPPFVEPEEYMAVQAYLDRQHKPGRGHRGRPPKHPLDGLLVCGACGGNYHQHQAKGYKYFRCATRYTRRACKNSRMVRAELWLEELLTQAFGRFADWRRDEFEAGREAERIRHSKSGRKAATARVELEALNRRIEALLTDADLTNEGTRAAYENLLKKAAALKSELAEVRPVQQTKKYEGMTLPRLREVPPALQTKFLRLMIERVIVDGPARGRAGFTERDRIEWC